VTAQFLSEFERLYEKWRAEGIEAILPLYREYSITLGSRVRVIGLTETFEAHAEDICADGSLLVRRDDGTMQTVHAGDVSVRGVMDYV
jgi:BirA family biotin operon repressor/biotin-[acetyl-CoA-carboxylase] ligase